jgi:hypothetical protein
MIDISSLDHKLNDLKPSIIQAGKSLLKLYNNRIGSFYTDAISRINSVREKNLQISIRPTSTNRSFFALYEFLRFIDEEDINILGKDAFRHSSTGFLSQSVLRTLEGIVKHYLKTLENGIDYALAYGNRARNMFTEGHLLMSIAILQSVANLTNVPLAIDSIRMHSQILFKRNFEDLFSDNRPIGGRMHQNDEVHHLITLLVVQALDSFPWEISTNDQDKNDYNGKMENLTEAVKEDVARMLGYYHAGVSSKYDPGELSFAITLINRSISPDTLKLTNAAVAIIAALQAPDGAWPSARIISYRTERQLHVTSYEIALSLTHLLQHTILRGDLGSCNDILKILDNAFHLVRSYYSDTSYDGTIDVSGWANDHRRRRGVIESWVTAIVLTFLIHYHDALFQLRQHLVLQKYRQPNDTQGTGLPTASIGRRQLTGTSTDGISQELRWPELMPALRDPSAIAINKFEKADLYGKASLVEGIAEKASIMASATSFCFCTTQKHLTARRARISKDYGIIPPMFL